MLLYETRVFPRFYINNFCTRKKCGQSLVRPPFPPDANIYLRGRVFVEDFRPSVIDRKKMKKNYSVSECPNGFLTA